MTDLKLIAEFCQNHNGSFDILRRMIGEAAEGGATHGKIQTIFANDLSYRERFETGVVSADGAVKAIRRPYKSEYERLKTLELTFEEHERFIDLCKAEGLIPLTTAFNLMCVPHLAELGFKSIKIASYDCASLPLIECVADNFQEMIISTGATFDDEIEQAASYLNDKKIDYTLLHCVTLYPTPLSEMNLARLDYLRKLAPKVGLSNHALTAADGVTAELVAIQYGATVVERHFTVLDPNATRDGLVSITKSHLQTIVKFAKLSKADQRLYLKQHVKDQASLIGSPIRNLSQAELLNRDYYRGRFCNKLPDGTQIYNWDQAARTLLV